MSQTVSESREPQEPLFRPVDAVKLVATVAILVGAIAGLAGRWDWWPGWVFLGVFITYSLALFWWLARVDQDLARERQRDADERNQPYERVIVPLMVVLEVALLAVAVLDNGRFGWSAVPAWARLVGCIMVMVTGVMVPWVFRTNTFASGVGRIQDSREHQVITGGPYRYVRHPMYAGIIIGFLGLPLALGSWWALIPGLLLAGLFVVRTALEDRMLVNQLPGYAAYAQRTHFRLLPGVW